MSEDRKKETTLHAVPISSPPPEGAIPKPPAAPALEALYRQHSDRVLQAAYRVTGNATDAEDALQTVFLRLLRREEAPRPAQSSDDLAPYLHRAAVNAGLDILRSKKRKRAVPLEPDGRELNADPRPGPEHLQANRELRLALRRALSRLSPRSAEIFTLRFFEGLSNKRIAQMLGTSQTAIGVNLHRTRGQLRKHLTASAAVDRQSNSGETS